MPGTGELRVLRRRIKGVKSTQKITRAMELIAASRIQRARKAVEAARPYAEAITAAMGHLSQETDLGDHPLLEGRETVSTVAIVLIASDRGLAGAYNTNVIRRAERLALRFARDDVDVRWYVVGKKAISYFRFREIPIAHEWTDISDRPGYEDARGIADRLIAEFTEGTIDEVHVAYTDFRSALNQVASAAQLLPVEPSEFLDEEDLDEGSDAVYVYEPDAAELLERLVPRYTEHRLYAALLESAASEHASRQRAKKAATDNASEIIEDLTREANRARQSAITTEITEIVGGAEALSADSR